MGPRVSELHLGCRGCDGATRGPESLEQEATGGPSLAWQIQPMLQSPPARRLGHCPGGLGSWARSFLGQEMFEQQRR